jgi:hypothetical protein
VEIAEYETIPTKVRAFKYTDQTWDEIYGALGWDKSEMQTVFEEDPAVSPDTFEVSINGGADYAWVARDQYVVLDEYGFVTEVLDEIVFTHKYTRPYDPMGPIPGLPE